MINNRHNKSNKKELIWFLAGITFGITLCNYSKLKSNYFKPSAQIIESHNVLKKNFDTFLKILIASNPTCTACSQIDNLLQNLNDNKISHELVFQPSVNVDVYLANYLKDKRDAIKIYNWLRNNKTLWEDLTDPAQVFDILIKHKLISSLPSNLNYSSTLLYSQFLTDLLNITFLPSISIIFTLSGTIDWDDIQPLLQQMKHIYNALKLKGKVV